MSKRNEVADFWDKAVKEWFAIADRDWKTRLENGSDDLSRWYRSYSGKGDGDIVLKHGLEAFAGDLRGIRHEARLVTLGLNPGVGYDELLSREVGVWSKRIDDEGYSHCFRRGPATAPEEWKEVRKRYVKGRRLTSPYWDRLIKFAPRWLTGSPGQLSEILNFELYPWHSNSKTAGIKTPPDLVERYIFEPIAEIDVPHVFAFGADWFPVVTKLERLRKLKPIRPGFNVLGAADYSHHWKMGLYELPSKQVLVVSSYSGSAGPPGEKRMQKFRDVMDSARRGAP